MSEDLNGEKGKIHSNLEGLKSIFLHIVVVRPSC